MTASRDELLAIGVPRIGFDGKPDETWGDGVAGHRLVDSYQVSIALDLCKRQSCSTTTVRVVDVIRAHSSFA